VVGDRWMNPSSVRGCEHEHEKSNAGGSSVRNIDKIAPKSIIIDVFFYVISHSVFSLRAYRAAETNGLVETAMGNPQPCEGVSTW
jgi:hypothetical protein